MGTTSKKPVNKGTKTASAKKAPSKESKGSAKPAKGKTKSRSVAPASAAARGDEPKRKMGIRGAAPWAARHAAKHAAEARARAALPAPPGSARATIRTPDGAEKIKERVLALHRAIADIRARRKDLNHEFYAVGLVLIDVRDRRLYETRGFGSFEAFCERETDLGKLLAARIVKITEVFRREAAMEYGMERVLAALNVLDGPNKPASNPPPSSPGSPGSQKTALPMHPPQPAKKS